MSFYPLTYQPSSRGLLYEGWFFVVSSVGLLPHYVTQGTFAAVPVSGHYLSPGLTRANAALAWSPFRWTQACIQRLPVLAAPARRPVESRCRVALRGGCCSAFSILGPLWPRCPDPAPPRWAGCGGLVGPHHSIKVIFINYKLISLKFI